MLVVLAQPVGTFGWFQEEGNKFPLFHNPQSLCLAADSAEQHPCSATINQEQVTISMMEALPTPAPGPQLERLVADPPSFPDLQEARSAYQAFRSCAFWTATGGSCLDAMLSS